MPVVAVTGHALDGAEADDFALVLKPVDPWRLCREVARLLDRDRLGP